MPLKHELPGFLKGEECPEAYDRWLRRKAVAPCRRDRKRGYLECTVSRYKELIHAAVKASAGKDDYTGEELNWKLISTYSNEESKLGRHGYKAGFALLPPVDHVDAAATQASFKICAWRTNDAKNDLSFDAFLDLCQKVLTHHRNRVENPG
jgi:hypothetical protein